MIRVGVSRRVLVQPGQAQAEWAWVPGSAPRWFTRPKTGSHLALTGTIAYSNYVHQPERVTATLNWQPCPEKALKMLVYVIIHIKLS